MAGKELASIGARSNKAGTAPPGDCYLKWDEEQGAAGTKEHWGKGQHRAYRVKASIAPLGNYQWWLGDDQ